MNRDDYKLVAGVIAEIRADKVPGEDQGEAADALVQQKLDDLANRLAQEFQKRNPFFDRGRFLKTAGAAD